MNIVVAKAGVKFLRKPVPAPQSPKQVEWPAFPVQSWRWSPEKGCGNGDNINNVNRMRKSSHDDRWRNLRMRVGDRQPAGKARLLNPWQHATAHGSCKIFGISDRRGLSILLAASRFRRNIIWAGLFLKPVKAVRFARIAVTTYSLKVYQSERPPINWLKPPDY